MIFKCPLSYSLVRNMTALDPREMAANPNNCREKFKRILTVLVNSYKVRAETVTMSCNNISTFWTGFQLLGLVYFHL